MDPDPFLSLWSSLSSFFVAKIILENKWDIYSKYNNVTHPVAAILDFGQNRVTASISEMNALPIVFEILFSTRVQSANYYNTALWGYFWHNSLPKLRNRMN